MLSHILHDLDVLVLKRVSAGTFEVGGDPAPWTRPVFGESLTTPGEASDFLANFLIEAEEFWADRFPGGVQSGIWCETGDDHREYYLEASAMLVEESPVLVIRSLGREVEEGASLGQRSHDQQLARRELLKDMEKKEILLNCIVHDLSNPLTALLINLERLERHVDSEGGTEALETATEVAHRQIKLVQSISSLFAAEMANLGHFEASDENTAYAADEAQSIVRAHLGSALDTAVSLLLENEIPDGGDRVYADPARLQRVIENLVTNAIRYAPEDSTVVVRLLPTLDGFVRVEIDDEGPGVPEEIDDQIFNPFVRDKRTGGKSGLGLYFCKMTVNRWGGEIGFEPLPSGGTRFWFTMRRAK